MSIMLNEADSLVSVDSIGLKGLPPMTTGHKIASPYREAIRASKLIVYYLLIRDNTYQ